MPLVCDSSWSAALSPAQLPWLFMGDPPPRWPEPTPPEVWIVGRSNPAISCWDTDLVVSKLARFPFVAAFAYTQEDVKFILTPIAGNGEVPIGSMGNDAALPVLSNRPKVFYNYFKQLFAQVTNPWIDPIREELVTSLVSFIGPKPNLLGIDELNPPLRLEVSQPVRQLRGP